MKVTKDSHADYSSGRIREQIPVLDLTTSAPLAGSIALSTPSITPYYANGSVWLPFGGGSGVLESGSIGIENSGITFTADGAYHQVLFNTDLSPLTPAHPSFNIDVPNSQIVINTNGNYVLYYNLAPTNTFLASTIQPEIYTSQLVTSIPSNLAFSQVSGSFQLNGATLNPPEAAASEIIPYVKLSGTWSGFLPAGTTINTSMSITTASPQSENLFGEGGRSQYMGIIRIA
jgi:hypothetical protein